MTYLIACFLPLLLCLSACHKQLTPSQGEVQETAAMEDPSIVLGAERMDVLLPLLAEKRVAVVANHTSMVGDVHLVDTLLSEGIRVVAIFSPEHGFRGDADAGALLESSVDARTGLPIISLYGASKKPAAEDLLDLDMVVFDIQDVGVRFYTYTSTMHYVMEACAEQGIPFLVLDRPNPNGFYVDGPVLDMQHKSFVGMHPVALVHGMTVAEYALMINSEGWLSGGITCDLQYIKCLHYTHQDYYELPINPSPNLKDMRAIYLYPSLGIFEGTVMSVGRGTPSPFMVIGHPDFAQRDFSFTPESIPGEAMNPKLKGKLCYGIDLGAISLDTLRERKRFDVSYVQNAYAQMPKEQRFFNAFFVKLIGDSNFQQQLEDGLAEAVIRDSWEPALSQFKTLRKKYLLYPDVE